jgi:hypothetical protein
MRSRMTRIPKALASTLVALVSIVACARERGAPAPMTPAAAPNDQVARGAYLATIGGCDDCHTPKKITAHGMEPDLTRRLSGHPASERMPAPPPPSGPWVAAVNDDGTAFAGPWGVSFGANLTPDKETGIGGWTADEFIAALRTGKVGDAALLPPMPWQNIGKLTDDDLRALFAFLRTLPPVKNQVPAGVVPGGHEHHHH